MTPPQSSAGVGSDLANSFSLAQTAFENLMAATVQAKESAETRFKWSKCLAVGLKLIAFFGGLAILIGLGEKVTRGVGILVAVAVGVDAVFLNHAKLLAFEQAADAYEVLIERMRNKFQNEHVLLVPIQSSQPVKFATEMVAMLTRLRNELFDSRQQISKALKAVNREALKALSLQVPIQGIPNVPAPSPPAAAPGASAP